jgi:hypothetical protein
MQSEPIRLLLVTIAGLASWQGATVVLGKPEAWDSPNYLGFYLAALGLCAAFGYFFPERAWRWGLIIVFAQLPVMLFQSGTGPLMVVGLGFLTAMALPAVAAATATSYLRKLQRRS